MTAPIADLLADAVPDAEVLAGGATAGYQITGLRPAAVVRATSAEQVATVLHVANEHGWAVAPRGGGTMLDLGNPIARLDLVLDLSSMNAVTDYQPDDLTLTAQAGVTLSTIHRLLEERGQMLPLDVPLPEQATVGGALATNAFGPRRLRYGTARDLVIGMQTALPAEGLARSGGKVVKNVAGYDLAKLHIGGLGTAGVITEVTFKLWPSPPARGAFVASFAALDAAHAAARQITSGQLFPTAVELVGPAAGGQIMQDVGAEPARGQWLVAVLLMGVREAIVRQARDIAALATGPGSLEMTELEPRQAERLFARIRDYGRSADDPAELILRASVLPADTAKAIGLVEDNTPSLGAISIIAQPGSGIVRAYWPSAPAERVPELVRRRREALRPLGALVVERAPASAAATIDAWGIDGSDIALMRRLKQTYDLAGVLNPQRYVGGL